MQIARIGIIGDFNPEYPLHLATNGALEHAADSLGVTIHSKWLATDAIHNYSEYQALLCGPGSPYRSLEGALNGIQYARESGLPFLGTCGGFQHAVLEFARNVMGLHDAMHAEYDRDASVLFVTPLSCSLVGKSMHVNLVARSRARAAYGEDHVEESYYCSFGLNPTYQESLLAAGMCISGWGEDQEPRIVELPSHPFFLATLFVPQAHSTPGTPHPIIRGFCRAAVVAS